MGIGWPDGYEGRLAKDVGGESALDVLVRGRLGPVRGRQFEDPMHGPAGQEAEQGAKVRPRFDLVKLAAGEEGDEGAVRLAAEIAAEEQPVLAFMANSP